MDAWLPDARGDELWAIMGRFWGAQTFRDNAALGRLLFTPCLFEEDRVHRRNEHR